MAWCFNTRRKREVRYYQWLSSIAKGWWPSLQGSFTPYTLLCTTPHWNLGLKSDLIIQVHGEPCSSFTCSKFLGLVTPIIGHPTTEIKLIIWALAPSQISWSVLLLLGKSLCTCIFPTWLAKSITADRKSAYLYLHLHLPSLVGLHHHRR